MENSINLRYSKEYSEEFMMQNQYSLINPVGEYDYYATSKIMSWFVKKIIAQGKKISDISILDAGCGDGRKTRILAEILGSSEKIKCFELVEEGVKHCRRVNSSIDCQIGNIVNAFPNYDTPFDAIMSCSVFMFIQDEDSILKALSNIYNNLKSDGLFMWFEVNSKTHFKGKNQEMGFNVNEMDRLANQVGFELVDSTNLFRNLKIRGTSTYYLYPSWGISIVEFINKIHFLEPSFNIRLYKKYEITL